MNTGKFNRRVVLIKPPAQAADSFGEMVAAGQPVRYRVWTSRKELTGNEVLGEEQEFGVNRLEFDFWYRPEFDGIGSHWSMEDEGGGKLDIVSAVEVGGRRWQIRVTAVRRG